MANWRQIQGRIRRARTSSDPAGKLNELFQKTRDAMVAFEAGAVEEKAGRNDEAVRWYTIAAQRFRRADWRTKSAEALTRLGAPVPEETSAALQAPHPREQSEDGSVAAGGSAEPNAETTDEGGPALGEILPEDDVAEAPKATASARPAGERPRRRRGRRGGRRHKRGGERNAPARTGAEHSHTSPHAAAHTAGHSSSHSPGHSPVYIPVHHQPSHTPVSAVASEMEDSSEGNLPNEGIASAATRFVPEPAGAFVERATYIRAGDPALASRFAQLESLLRRLISAPLHRMDELDDAPAGPGVFLLSDSDLMTNYYVEACQTLRIGASQLARAGRAGRGARTEGKAALRSQLAEHLEISDTQVTDYLRKHCVVRWLQLDEDAPHVAHFAIALLRPALNGD